MRSDSAPSEVFARFSNLSIFARFSNLSIEEYHVLQPGQRVEFLLEVCPRGQDGYVFRAEKDRAISA